MAELTAHNGLTMVRFHVGVPIPVRAQSQILGQPAMGHAGRPWLLHGPNSGCDSRDGGLSTHGPATRKANP